MRIGILVSGIVGQTLGLKLVQLGHTVSLGTRDPSKLDEKKGRGPSQRSLREWLAATADERARVGTFRDAAAHGELLINAVSGAASLDALSAAGVDQLNGKTLIDVSNPVDASRGLPLTLFVKDTDSLGETLQRTFPTVRVVKTLNTVFAAIMVNPALVADGEHTVFVSGNDPQAKAQTIGLLREFGWRDILDLGDLSTARGTEMMLSIGHAVARALGPTRFNFRVVR